MGIPIKTDYDIFFPSEKEYQSASEFFKRAGAEVKWESNNGMKVKYKGRTFDLIKKFFDTPTDTINNFDFTVSMFAVDYDKVYFGDTSFIDLAKRQLMINKITFPASTLSRSFRYYKKGFTMCMGEMKKLFDSIQATSPATQSSQVSQQNDQAADQSSGEMSMFFSGID